jgi:hypothetical protein
MVKLKLELKSNEVGAPNYYDQIKKCLLSGFFMQVALL